MKKKSSRRRIDVNVDELDRIIDTALRGPLNEAEGRTLSGFAVHAMAERLVGRCNTEKTSAVPRAENTARVLTITAGTGETIACGAWPQWCGRFFGRG